LRDGQAALLVNFSLVNFSIQPVPLKNPRFREELALSVFLEKCNEPRRHLPP